VGDGAALNILTGRVTGNPKENKGSGYDKAKQVD
jgi:hypothetical protein